MYAPDVAHDADSENECCQGDPIPNVVHETDSRNVGLHKKTDVFF